MKVQQERLRTEGQNLKLLACSSYATSLNIYLVKSTLVLNQPSIGKDLYLEREVTNRV